MRALRNENRIEIWFKRVDIILILLALTKESKISNLLNLVTIDIKLDIFLISKFLE